MEDCHTDSELLTQFHKNTPQLRFSGFDDDWEEKKLGEIVTEFKNPVELPHNGYTRLGIRSHAKGTFHEYVAPGHELEAAQMSEVKADNLIMSITFAWEHAVAITDKNDEGKLVSQRFPQFSFNKGQVPEFYKYVIADEKFRHHLWLSSPGGAGRNRVLNIKESMEYKSHIPSSDFEQQKIGTFLSHVDSLIQAKTKKLESFKAVKKSLLQKCFPKAGEKVPEMRFAGFNGDWEEKEFIELVSRESKTKISDENNPCVEYEDVTPEIGILNNDVYKKKVRKTGISFDNKNILYGKLRPYLHNWLKPNFEGVAVGDWWVLEPNNVDRDFLYRLIQTNKFDDIANQSSGSKMPRADWNLISHSTFSVPMNIEEQQKIGQFFLKYDSFISAQQKEIDKLKDIKKSLLQKMFI